MNLLVVYLRLRGGAWADGAADPSRLAFSRTSGNGISDYFKNRFPKCLIDSEKRIFTEIPKKRK